MEFTFWICVGAPCVVFGFLSIFSLVWRGGRVARHLREQGFVRAEESDFDLEALQQWVAAPIQQVWIRRSEGGERWLIRGLCDFDTRRPSCWVVDLQKALLAQALGPLTLANIELLNSSIDSDSAASRRISKDLHPPRPKTD